MMANAASASVSMTYGLQGPCETIVTACAAGTHSIGRAAELISSGKVKAMVAGGAEATLTPIGTQGFVNMTAVSNEGISRPLMGMPKRLVGPTDSSSLLLLQLKKLSIRLVTS